MAEKHLDALFSAAYDDELDPVARRRFDTHLEACDRCAQGWDDYRAALDAVRALPAVAMPATVRLPVGPPQVEAGRAALLGRLRDALLHPQPVWAAAGLAAVSLAAVILAVHHPGGGTGSSAPLSVAAPGALNGNQVPYDSSQLAPVVPCPVSPVAAGAAAPAAFAYTAHSDATTGGELVLATRSDTYAPGASVPIYARLTGVPASAGGSDVIPCVTLETVGATSNAGSVPVPRAAPAAPGAAAQAPAPPADGQPQADASTISPTPLAVATSEPQAFSAAGAGAGGAANSLKSTAPGPLLTVTIPPNVPRGTVLRLVAVIPPHFSGNPGDTPIRVELLIKVS